MFMISKPKVAGSTRTAGKQTFQFAQCGHTRRQNHKHISVLYQIYGRVDDYYNTIPLGQGGMTHS